MARMASIASVVAGAPQGTPKQSWKNGGSAKMPLAYRFLASAIWPEVEHLQLGLDPSRAHGLGDLGDVVGRVDKGVLAKVHRGDVKTANLGPQLQHMVHPVGGAGHAGRGVAVGVALIRRKTRTDAGGQVDDDLGLGSPDALHHIAVQRDVAAGSASFGVAHMQMHHGGPRRMGGQSVIGDLFGGDRHKAALRRWCPPIR